LIVPDGATPVKKIVAWHESKPANDLAN